MDPDSTISVDIDTQSPKWEDCTIDFQHICHTVLTHIGFYAQCATPCSIAVVLGSDQFIQALNSEYRDKDTPTNVLSFPNTDCTPGHFFISEDTIFPDEPVSLGDIIFAYETIEQEATDQHKSFNDHLTHLIVHGTLHLLGYDHEDEEDAAFMEQQEIDILTTLAIANPYETVQTNQRKEEHQHA